MFTELLGILRELLPSNVGIGTETIYVARSCTWWKNSFPCRYRTSGFFKASRVCYKSLTSIRSLKGSPDWFRPTPDDLPFD